MNRFHSPWPWLLLVSGFLVLAYFMAGYDLATGRGLPLHSCRRYDPFGSSALRELAEYRGKTTRYLERPVPPPENDATLIMILPIQTIGDDAQDFSEKIPGHFGRRRLQRLREWTAAGNRIIVLGRLLPGYMDTLAAPVFPPDKAAGAIEFETWQARGGYSMALLVTGFTVPLVNDADSRLYLVRPSSVAVPADGSILAGDDDQAFAIQTAMGRGSITVIGDPTPALNFALPREDNARFLLSLVGGGPVYFDEYSLGLGQENSTLDWLKRHGLIPFLLQAIFAMFLLARSTDSVLEKPEEIAPPDRPPAGEQIRILAGLYERTLSDEELDRKKRHYARRMGSEPDNTRQFSKSRR